MLLIQKVSPNFALMEGGEYNLGHWREVNPITHIGIKEEKYIAFFNISGGEIKDGFSTKSGWSYYGVLNTVQGIRVLQLSPKVSWEEIKWEGNEKGPTRKVPPLPPDPELKRKREGERSYRYKW